MKNKKYSWNLTDLYESDDDPRMEKDLKVVIKKNYEFINKWKERSDYLKDPKILREALDEYNELDEKYGTTGSLGYYLFLRNAQDESDKTIIKKQKALEEKSIEITNDMEFFELNICKIPKEKHSLFLNSKYLTPYKHFLEREFDYAKFLLSEKEEQLLTLTGPTSFSNWIDMLSQFISKETINVLTEEGKKVEVPFSAREKYLISKQKKVRDVASKEVVRILTKLSNIAEHEINSILQDKKNIDKLRGHKRADETRLFGGDISIKTVDQMLSCVENNYSLPNKYYKFKAKLMGQKKFSYFERLLPYGENNKEYTYKEAITIIRDLMFSLDKDFGDIFDDMEKKGRYDVFPSKGKTDGAFCTTPSKILPVYVLLNFQQNLRSVTTIAHETGHAINHHIMVKHQLELNCSTPLSVAEVSSTFFEGFVLEDIIKSSDDETKLAILIQKLDDDIGTIHRQVACYRFEQELHEKFRIESFLPKEKISEILKKHMKAYMGDYVSQDEGTEYYWVIWSHIRNFFYVYSYANGLLISKALQRMVREDPKNISKVKKMLSTGTSESPEDMFKTIGIDITKKEFWEEGLQEIEDTYEEAYALAKKLGKI